MPVDVITTIEPQGSDDELVVHLVSEAHARMDGAPFKPFDPVTITDPVLLQTTRLLRPLGVVMAAEVAVGAYPARVRVLTLGPTGHELALECSPAQLAKRGDTA